MLTSPKPKSNLALSEMALQMESLISALLPFKRDELSRLKANRDADIAQMTTWWGKTIANCEEEIVILSEHAAALGLEPEPETEAEAETKLDLIKTIASNWPDVLEDAP